MHDSECVHCFCCEHAKKQASVELFFVYFFFGALWIVICAVSRNESCEEEENEEREWPFIVLSMNVKRKINTYIKGIWSSDTDEFKLFLFFKTFDSRLEADLMFDSKLCRINEFTYATDTTESNNFIFLDLNIKAQSESFRFRYISLTAQSEKANLKWKMDFRWYIFWFYKHKWGAT